MQITLAEGYNSLRPKGMSLDTVDHIFICSFQILNSSFISPLLSTAIFQGNVAQNITSIPVPLNWDDVSVCCTNETAVTHCKRWIAGMLDELAWNMQLRCGNSDICTLHFSSDQLYSKAQFHSAMASFTLEWEGEVPLNLWKTIAGTLQLRWKAPVSISRVLCPKSTLRLWQRPY